MPFFTLKDFSFDKKTILVRLGIDSPVDPETGAVVMNDRLRESAETISFLANQGAKVVCIGHQGRPGGDDFTTTKKHAELLSIQMGKEVMYVDEVFGGQVSEKIKQLQASEIMLLENVRFSSEEMLDLAPDEHAKSHLVRSLESSVDYYVNDAFTNCHRAHASMTGFTRIPNIASDHVRAEIEGIKKAATHGEQPFVFVLGGAKIDDYIPLMKSMLKQKKLSKILVGGILADLVLAAQGIELGAAEEQKLSHEDSLTQSSLVELIPEIQQMMKEFPGIIESPFDVAIDKDGVRAEIDVADLPTGYEIKDIGSKTITRYRQMIKDARTIFVKGPMGLYEEEQFAIGSQEIIRAIADAAGYTLVGGGNTAAVIEKYASREQFDHISLAGGATLKMIEKGTLPCIQALEKNYEQLQKKDQHTHALTN